MHTSGPCWQSQGPDSAAHAWCRPSQAWSSWGPMKWVFLKMVEFPKKMQSLLEHTDKPSNLGYKPIKPK